MKRFLSIALALLLVLSLTACGSNPYDKYEHINKMLDEGDYEGAVQAIYELYLQNQATTTPSGDQPNQADPIPTTTEKPQPTEDEWQLLYEYRDIVRQLSNYENRESDYTFSYYDGETSYSGSAAFACVYNRLQELASLDPWLEQNVFEELRGDSETNCDRQSFLDKFTQLEDVLLNITYSKQDNMGNTSKDSYYTPKYYANGLLSYTKDYNIIRPEYSFSWYTPEYDANGRIIQCVAGSSGNISAILDYVYEGDQLIQQVQTTNSGEKEYLYSYNDQGQLEKISYYYSYYTDIFYTYDDQGRVIKAAKVTYSNEGREEGDINGQTTMEYTYDAKGHLVSGVYTSYEYRHMWIGNDYRRAIYSEAKDQYTFTCDDQGRVTKAEIIPGNRIVVAGEDAGKVTNKPTYQNGTYDLTYGTYFLYGAE